jgi:ATP-dependent Clp protease ATP-binding subunit ClpC
MFERFTDPSRRVIVEAQNVSKELGHNYIDTEHLLLGLLRDPESEATKVLYALGVSLEVATLHLADHFNGVASQATPPPHVPFTPRAKKVLEMALREALNLGANYIAPEHILLGILLDEESEASKVLKELDVDYGAVLRQHMHPTQPTHLATSGDGRVRVTELGNTITVMINADASIDLDGYAFGGESYGLKAKYPHTITINLATPPSDDAEQPGVAEPPAD